MAQTQPIVIQQAGGYGGQNLIGALAGVLAWWLIETLTSARERDDDETVAA
jgi:hypothetical protein